MSQETIATAISIDAASLELAQQANEAHDTFTKLCQISSALAETYAISGRETPTDLEAILRDERIQAAGLFSILSAQAGDMINSNAQQSKAEDGPEKTNNPWKLLNPEQRVMARKLSGEMARKFDLSSGDFSIVMVGDNDFSVVYTANSGIYLGSWDQITDDVNSDDFTIEIDGIQVDARKGMTADVYSSFVAMSTARGKNPLPDSSELEKWSWTWLTGETAKVGRVDAPTAYTDQGITRFGSARKNLNDVSICFRPSAAIRLNNA